MYGCPYLYNIGLMTAVDLPQEPTPHCQIRRGLLLASPPCGLLIATSLSCPQCSALFQACLIFICSAASAPLPTCANHGDALSFIVLSLSFFFVSRALL